MGLPANVVEIREGEVIGQYWAEIRDGDPRGVGLFRRHYSCTNHKADHKRTGFSGPGETLVLLTTDGTALWCWRHDVVPRPDAQVGVNCTIFRNEGPTLSSLLVREACEWAWVRWPGQRLYTYVNGGKIRSINPGCCFKEAGWQTCGKSKGGLTILEVAP